MEMVRRQFLPALLGYQDTLSRSIRNKRSVADLPCTAECKLLKKLAGYYEDLTEQLEQLTTDIVTVESMEEMEKASFFYYETIIPVMEKIRTIADQTEELLPEGVLPYPNYEQLLFSV